MSASEVSGVHRALNNSLTTLTPEQVQKFLQEVQADAARNDATPDPAPVEVPNAAAITGRTDIMTRNQPARKRSRENAKLRPLNSFIAFRSFYSAAFPDLSQKIKSGLIRLLWGSDPFKAKWSILAKAYSIIRDNHSGKVGLESFLALVVPFIGIVSAESYLNVMGMQLASTEDKQFYLVRVSDEAGIDKASMTTTLSVDDVVRYCYQAGYVSGAGESTKSENQGVFLSMAVNAQPTFDSNAISFQPFENTSAQHSDQESKQIATRNSNPNNATSSKAGSDDPTTHVDPASQHNAAPVPAFNNNTSDLSNTDRTGTPVLYTAEDFETEVRRAMEAFPFDADDGYYGLFNPALRIPVATWNPFHVQDEFDGYSLGDYIGA
ncbi:hypothetical protein FQN57_002247 [Myotisia sp. PD_48]|nr:hypothetical protein FQN57_002247 [Myotisia sp. PD_48]